MDLSRYLDTMKNLPDRFSNIAFWRGVRKLKDKLVDTFEYVSEWGNGIEGRLMDIDGKISSINYSNRTRDSRLSALESSDVNLNTEITDIKSDITILENTDTSLDSRISALESSDVNLNTEITDIKSDITTLENTDTSLDSRISALESSDVNLNTEITNIKSDITTLENTDTSLDSRISALENAGGGGGGGGAIGFYSDTKSFTPTKVEVLESNLDTSETGGSLLVPYPKVIYARFIGELSDIRNNSIVIEALMNGSAAVSNGQQYSTTVQFHNEPMYAVRTGDTTCMLYTSWIPFTVKTKDAFRVTMPNLNVLYTIAFTG